MAKRIGPCLYLSGLPRTVTKPDWKWLYRLARISLREQEKANLDMILFGTGYVMCEPGEDPKHIPIEEVRIV